MNAIVPIGANALVPQDMDQAIRLAKAMSSAKLVPKHLHDDVGTCLMIVEQALRWRMSPFAVAQCTSSIGGKLMFEGKLIAAAVECSGAITGGFDYQFDGKGSDRTVTVSATRTGEKEPRTITIRLSDVKTDNAFWTKQPDQQLVYSGTRNWARRWTPSVILGAYAPEEFDRQADRIVTEDGAGPTIEHEPEAAKPAPTQREQINAAVPLSPPKAQRMTVAQYIDGIEIALREAATPAQINQVLDSAQVLELRSFAKGQAKQRLDTLLAEAAARAAPEPPAETDDDGSSAEEPWPGFAEPTTAA